MKLPVFDKKEDVPAAFASLYEEKDGKWVPKPDDSTTKLEETLAKVRGELKDAEKAKKDQEKAAKDLEKRLKDLEDAKAAEGAGITSEELKELKDKIQSDIDAAKATEIQELKDQIEELKGVGDENRTLKLDNVVKKIMGEKKVRSDRMDDLFVLISSEFDLTSDGKPKLVNHPGKDIGVFLEGDIKTKYPWAFQGSKADGGDAGGIVGGTPQVGTTPDDVLKNPAAAATAARAAGK